MMKSTVAIVDTNSLDRGFAIIGCLKHLNVPERKLVIKVGIYNPESGICTTVKTLNSIIQAFSRPFSIQVVESDSGAGLGLDRLKIWQECYNGRVKPFNLSDDTNTREINVAGEMVPLSHVLFHRTFISTHVPRRYEGTGDEDLMNMGTILKNLLGLIPDKKKFRFHDRLPTTLLDMYEAIGGIDLAILDATNVYLGRKKNRITVPTNLLLLGTDAIAVEAVGAHLVGFDPFKMPVLIEARNRELGEIDITKINVIGDLEPGQKMIQSAFEDLI